MVYNPRWQINWYWQQRSNAFVWYIFQEDVHEEMLCALLLPSNITAAELFKSLNDYISGKLNCLFCISICTDRMASMTGRLSGFTTQVKDVTSECESMHCVIHREMLASWKMSPEFNNVLLGVIKIINHIKVHALNTSVCTALWGDGHTVHLPSFTHRSEIVF